MSASNRELWRTNFRRSTIAIIGSNVVAAAVVFVYLSWIVPTPSVSHPARTTWINLAVLTAYLAVAFPIGTRLSIRVVAPVRGWMLEGRPPTAAERDAALRAPLRQLQILAVGWELAAAIFFVVDVVIGSVGLAGEVAITVALGGAFAAVQRVPLGELAVTTSLVVSSVLPRPWTSWIQAATIRPERGWTARLTSPSRPLLLHAAATV